MRYLTPPPNPLLEFREGEKNFASSDDFLFDLFPELAQ
jgi:hypothetical protein